ncbi:mechanosensitive ion channel family protein [Methanotorris igneus]|uniref:MscS Mechanosensitive ion channel n=1 Tax=Methanotorris igneus (strain DSM 5666 / JCM 11834 / Kol 5) TaxID=880724 RepID=F6BDB9_METIK|nr:mechanosensitive ion channel family protein [Methanotorris igneus]AEF96480.1 MscS Mechanosensitive ion channel [Methanotorris igneus Kol 5]
MEILNAVYFGNPLKNYLLCILSILFGIFLGRVLHYVIKNYIKAMVSRTKTKLDDIFLYAIDEPLVILAVISGIWIGFSFLELPENISILINEGVVVAVTLCVILFLIKFVDDFILEYVVPLTEKTESKLDDQLIPPLRKFLKILIVVFGFVVILDNLGYDVTTLLAGLGIGGLAVALASKDTLENLIAGILIIVDKPFTIGDWIKVSDYEGIVEEIGIRSTRIRTFGDSLITIPNASLSTNVIENFSAMRKRRVLTTIGITYDTPADKIKKAEEILKDILKNHPAVVEPIRIHFVEYGDWSLNLRVEYFIKNLGFDYYLNALNEINLKIKEEFEKEGIEMAFPTQTVYLRRDN